MWTFYEPRSTGSTCNLVSKRELRVENISSPSKENTKKTKIKRDDSGVPLIRLRIKRAPSGEVVLHSARERRESSRKWSKRSVEDGKNGRITKNRDTWRQRNAVSSFNSSLFSILVSFLWKMGKSPTCGNLWKNCSRGEGSYPTDAARSWWNRVRNRSRSWLQSLRRWKKIGTRWRNSADALESNSLETLFIVAARYPPAGLWVFSEAP